MKGDKLHRRKLRSAPSSEKEEDIEENNRLRDEEHDQIIEDLQMLRDHYKAVYKEALESKVQLQRKRLRENRMKILDEEQKAKDHEERQRHKISVRLPKSDVLNDDTFMRGMQHSEYYKIISIENQLRKEGFLEKLHDVQDFWEYITADGNLEKVIEEGQIFWENVKRYEQLKIASAMEQPLPRKEQEQNKKKVQFDHAMTKANHWQSIMHSHRQLMTPSSAGDSENWKDAATGSAKSGRKSSKTKPSRATLIEQTFPKVDFPPLAAYQLEFGECEPDTEEVRKAEEAQRRLNGRETMRRTLETMYSHASANRAATQRLMDRNKEFSFDSFAGASSVRELLSHAEDYDVPTMAPPRQKQPQRLTKREEQRSRLGSHSACKSSKRETHSAGSSTYSQSLSVFDESTYLRQNVASVLPPLTLEKLGQSCVQKEATGLSTLWTNPFS